MFFERVECLDYEYSNVHFVKHVRSFFDKMNVF